MSTLSENYFYYQLLTRVLFQSQVMFISIANVLATTHFNLNRIL